MRRPPKSPAQCVVELDDTGMVLTGTVRSIGLVLEDAIRTGERVAFVLSASGDPVWLRALDEFGVPIRWTLRDAVW